MEEVAAEFSSSGFQLSVAKGGRLVVGFSFREGGHGSLGKDDFLLR